MEGETKASEIQQLEARANDLSDAVDWWNALIVVSLVVAALAAVFVAVTTRIGFVRSKQLTAVQARLIQEKDSQLALNLKDKDQKIADSKELAAAAEARAAEANLALEEV